MFTDEPFLLQTEIHCMSPWQLSIKDSSYQWNNTITIASQMPHQVKDCEFVQTACSSLLALLLLLSGSLPARCSQRVPLSSGVFICASHHAGHLQPRVEQVRHIQHVQMCYLCYVTIGMVLAVYPIVTIVPLPQVLVKQLPFVVSAGERYCLMDYLHSSLSLQRSHPMLPSTILSV